MKLDFNPLHALCERMCQLEGIGPIHVCVICLTITNSETLKKRLGCWLNLGIHNV
jgi:hypothetical protein